MVLDLIRVADGARTRDNRNHNGQRSIEMDIKLYLLNRVNHRAKQEINLINIGQ